MKPIDTENTVQEEPISILDSEALVTLFMGNRDTVSSLLVRFIERTTEQLDSGLPRNIAGEQWEAAQMDAHILTGSAMNLTAGEMGRIAARLELTCINRDKAGAEVLLSALREAFARFRTEAKRF